MGVEDKHLLFPMPLLKPQFDAIHTRRADPSRYLIIGFDTKYQRYADEDTRTLNNEVSAINTAVLWSNETAMTPPLLSGQVY